MSFPRYPEYVSSPIEWIRELPRGWSVSRFRHLFRESPEKIERLVVGPMLSVSGYRGIEVKEYDDENRRRLDEDLIGYRVVRVGQLVVNTMWLNYAGLGVSKYEGHVSPAYRCYWIDECLDGRFVHHLLRSDTYVQGYTQLLTGIRPNSLQISRDDLMDFPVLVPPRSEQEAIATFLDRETAKIDALVAEQQRLMELLNEKRQAAISHAVTKGVNPDAAMKPSGIEWIGDVPEHWEVMPLKRDLAFITSGSRGWAENYADEGDLFIRIANLTRDSTDLDLSDVQRVAVPDGAEGSRTNVLPGDVLFSITAYLGSVAVVPDLLESAYVSQHVALARLRRDRLSPEWVGLVALSRVGQTWFETQSYGGTKIQLSLDDVKGLPITAPPLSEQHAIVTAIHHELAKLNSLRVKTQQNIDLLIERRGALISAAVTGQIDIRGIAAPAAA